LGLPLTKRMIELHGGKLELQSAPGLGTTATLVFPLSRIVRPEKKNAAEDAALPASAARQLERAARAAEHHLT
ncbi:MAG: hypothetical protein ACREF6_04965, partial [Alphaproteobacteria bacterium]